VYAERRATKCEILRSTRRRATIVKSKRRRTARVPAFESGHARGVPVGR